MIISNTGYTLICVNTHSGDLAGIIAEANMQNLPHLLSAIWKSLALCPGIPSAEDAFSFSYSLYALWKNKKT